MPALARRAKQGRFSRFRYFGQWSVASRRPERHHKATANARRSPARFICHAECRRAVAVSQNSTDCVETRLTFARWRCILLSASTLFRLLASASLLPVVLRTRHQLFPPIKSREKLVKGSEHGQTKLHTKRRRGCDCGGSFRRNRTTLRAGESGLESH